jgi:DUF1680 family protein
VTQPIFINISPRDFSAVGGFLGQRFEVNRTKRLKDCVLSEQFIRLHEEKKHDAWFWLGEQIGKWLDAAAYTALIARDQDLLNRVHEILGRLARSQDDDGYLGIIRARYRNPVRGMELYEMYYVLLGLLACDDLLDNPLALQMARRLGDYIIKTWGPNPGQFPLAGRFPGNGHSGGEGTLILEPIVLLGQKTGDERYIQWGEQTLNKWDEWLAAYPEAVFTCAYTPMKQFAAGEKPVYELRERIHAHTFHMTLLGVAALYNATGKQEYQDVVLGCVNRLADEWIFLTGGMSAGERYLPRRYYNPRGDIEVCPQHTWILLLNQALQWTGQARYAAEIERDLFNHFLAAQLADGSNWSYMTPLNGQAQEPESPNCCNAAGHRIAGRMPTYLYGLRDNEPTVLLYTDSAATLRPAGLPAINVRQATTFPTEGQVKLYIDPDSPAHFRFNLRIPPYAEGATVQVGGESPQPAPAGDFVVIERDWQPGDVVNLSLPLPIRCQANEHSAALVRGPLVYAYFQNAQPDPATIYTVHRGLYPEDVALDIDPNQPAVSAEPAQEGLLGPALRVSGRILAQSPMFSTGQGNDAAYLTRSESLLLLPFVNQGAVRGDYRVFMNYKKPEPKV